MRVHEGWWPPLLLVMPVLATKSTGKLLETGARDRANYDKYYPAPNWNLDTLPDRLLFLEKKYIREKLSLGFF